MKHIIFDCDGTLLNTRNAPYSMYPGIKELILDLTGEFSLYVWTARGRGSLRRALEENGILAYFDGLWTPDDGIPKPHRAGLDHLVGGFSKEDIWMIGDTTNDIFGAKNYGIRAIAALWDADTRKESLLEAGADFLATHPEECSKIIRSN